MNRDCLEEFRAEVHQNRGSIMTAPAWIEMESINSTPDMVCFNSQVGHIQYWVDMTREKVGQIDYLNQRTLQAVGEDQTNRCREERDQLGAEIDESFRQAKSLLEQLTSQNQRMPPNTPDANARKGRTAAVTRQFQEVVERYREIEDSYWNKSRDRLKRQYKVAKPLATEEEIDQALDDERAGQVFTQSLLTSTRVGDARRVLREVETRQQEMRQIEKKALELNALFIRLNEIVNAQQADIDHIEVDVQEIAVDVREANRQAEGAIKIRRKTRTKLWVFLGIGVLIFAIVVVVIVIEVTKRTK